MNIHIYINAYILYIHIHVSDLRRWYTGIDIFMVLKKNTTRTRTSISVRKRERKKASKRYKERKCENV